jgi:arsenate reductase (thioredoxin)
MKILIVCTGNTCRSQMAEGFLRSLDKKLKVFSAGTNPGKEVNPYAVKVMNEIGIDISTQQTKNVDIFLSDTFDYVITVCDDAREACPYFPGNVEHRLHIAFDDPAKATGDEPTVLSVYRSVRDRIMKEFGHLYEKKLMSR